MSTSFTSPVIPPIPLGDDVIIEVKFTNPDGTPFNLAGASAKAGIKSAPNVTPAVAINKSTPASGMVITDAANGLANITLDSADTATGVAAGIYDFSAQAINAAGKKSTQIITKIPFVDHPTK
jgi:hypothetical protein